MVALYPPADVASALAVDGGIEPTDLHLTLAFLGSGLTDEQLAEAEAIVESVALRWPALVGQFGGLGQFPAAEDGVPVFAPVDVAFLSEVRDELVDHLQAAGVPVATDHGFTPHLTLTYLGVGDELPAAVPATPTGFSAISLVVGSERTDYPFTGGQQ
jgi:2'-5' RNA ligase